MDTDREELTEALKKCALFSGMDSLKISKVMSSTPSKLITYRRGEIYAVAGAPCKWADIIVRGIMVARMSSSAGKSAEIKRLGCGEIIAPAFIFASASAFPVSVEAAKETCILRITKYDFSAMLSSDRLLTANFIRTLSDINVFLTKKINMLSLMTVREKVISLLKQRAREQNVTYRSSKPITLYRSRQEIADSFGIQKFSLMRGFADLEKEGIIRSEGRCIYILEWDRMK